MWYSISLVLRPAPTGFKKEEEEEEDDEVGRGSEGDLEQLEEEQTQSKYMVSIYAIRRVLTHLHPYGPLSVLTGHPFKVILRMCMWESGMCDGSTGALGGQERKSDTLDSGEL